MKRTGDVPKIKLCPSNYNHGGRKSSINTWYFARVFIVKPVKSDHFPIAEHQKTIVFQLL